MPNFTGWPPGMLQDDSRELSRWLADKPEARRLVREVCEEIVEASAPPPEWIRAVLFDQLPSQ